MEGTAIYVLTKPSAYEVLCSGRGMPESDPSTLQVSCLRVGILDRVPNGSTGNI